MYKAEILADSLSPQGDRLTTMKITYPRIVHSEMMTHRMFSRNSASSRAIPFKKMVQMVEENPFIPMAWQKAHSGMQGNEYFEGGVVQHHISLWLEAKDNAVNIAKKMANDTLYPDRNLTKQLCNRLLEPFMWHTVLVTSGKEGLDNFFELRCPQYEYITGEVENRYFKNKKDYIKHFNNRYKHREGSRLTLKPEKSSNINWLQINKSQADIHIQAIAELMYDVYNESTPKQLQAGEWHIPFGDNITDEGIWSFIKHEDEIESVQVKIATARCARISYETLGDNPKIDYEADIKLHDILLKNGHASPLEHCARAMDEEEYYTFRNGQISVNNKGVLYDDEADKNTFGWCNNFRGFIQYRHLIDN